MNGRTVALDPDRRTLRRFGLIGAGLFALLAAWLAWRGSLLLLPLAPPTASTCACVFAGAAVFAAVLATLRPGALLLPYVALTLLGAPVGAVVSSIVLAVLYFGVMLPIGLLLRLVRRSPLGPEPRSPDASCWLVRTRPGSPERYHQQY